MITVLNVISKVSMFTLVCCLIYIFLYLTVRVISYILDKKVTKNTELVILIISFIITLTQFTFYDIY